MFGSSDEGHIGEGTAFMMVCIALVIDGVQALLALLLIGFIVNPAINIAIALPLFGIWFAHSGVSMMSPKNAFPFFATALVEFLPTSFFPFWTGFVILMYIRKKAKEVIAPPPRRYTGPWR